MKRLDAVLCAVFLAASPAIARPVASPKPLTPHSHVLLDLGGFSLFHRQQPSDSSSSGLFSGSGAQWSQQKSGAGLSLGGPLRAQFGPNDDPRAGLSSYKLQGMDQLGSEMSESHVGQAAKILFVWPTEK
ncbi:MAG TPA: hypothetical protein VGI20_09305 [Rhizomicrobium sp.]